MTAGRRAYIEHLCWKARMKRARDRLRCFEKGGYPSPHNRQAAFYCEQALDALKARTNERLARGVEGTHKV